MSRDETDPKSIDHWTDADVILPVQLHAEVHALRDPERRLRLAVLEDAIRCFKRCVHAPDRHGRAPYEDALDWFSSPDRSEPFSFENVCQALDLDAEYVRRGLRRWRDAERAGVASASRAGRGGGAGPRRAAGLQRRAA